MINKTKRFLSHQRLTSGGAARSPHRGQSHRRIYDRRDQRRDTDDAWIGGGLGGRGVVYSHGDRSRDRADGRMAHGRGRGGGGLYFCTNMPGGEKILNIECEREGGREDARRLTWLLEVMHSPTRLRGWRRPKAHCGESVS